MVPRTFNTVLVASLSKSFVPRETWLLLSFERDGNTRNFYLDGDKRQTSTLGGAFRPSIGSFYLGNYEDDSSFAEFYGYIDNVRLSTTARYSGSDFTVPTSAYTSDSDTLVLLPFDGNNNSTNITGTVNNIPSGSVTAFASATITDGVSASFTLDEDAVARAEAGVTITNGVSASFTLDEDAVARAGGSATITDGVSASFTLDEDAVVRSEASVTITDGVSATVTLDEDAVARAGGSATIEDGVSASGSIGTNIRYEFGYSVQGSVSAQVLLDDESLRADANVTDKGLGQLE